MNDKTCILIPVYNGSNFVLDAVDSALHQTHENLTVVVVDNCSTDNTLELLSSRKSDPRMSVISSDAHLSMVGNFHRALTHSHADFIRFLSADDVLEPDCIRRSLGPFQTYRDLGLVASSNRIIDDQGAVIGERSIPLSGYTSSRTLADFLFQRGNRIGGPSGVTIKSDALPVPAIDQSLICSFDFDLWVKLSARWALFGLPEPLYSVRIHNDQGTNRCLSRFKIEDQEIRHRVFIGRTDYPKIGKFRCLWLAITSMRLLRKKK